MNYIVQRDRKIKEVFILNNKDCHLFLGKFKIQNLAIFNDRKLTGKDIIWRIHPNKFF